MPLVQKKGFLYLRYEYKYLHKFLESILEELRHKNLLGKSIGGKKDLILISEFSLVQVPMYAVKNRHLSSRLKVSGVSHVTDLPSL
jgi:hypothetical protein